MEQELLKITSNTPHLTRLDDLCPIQKPRKKKPDDVTKLSKEQRTHLKKIKDAAWFWDDCNIVANLTHIKLVNWTRWNSSHPLLPREVWGYISKQEANEAGLFLIGKANINGKEVVRVLQGEWVRDPTHSRLSQKTLQQIMWRENKWHQLP